MPRRPQVYLFGWPSGLGGADTKAGHLLRLLHGDFAWTLVPNDPGVLEDAGMRRWLEGLGVRAARWEDLPGRLEGTGLGICNSWWLTHGRAIEARGRGLRLVWGNEMMWHHAAELAAVASGLLEAVLYVSPEQRAVLEPGYARAAMAVPPARDAGEVAPDTGPGASGRLGALRWWDVGNFVDPEAFPMRGAADGERFAGEFVIGRLSRADPGKYPEDFPESWERLGLSRRSGRVRHRVMAWSDQMARLFSRHPELARAWRRWKRSRTVAPTGRHAGTGARWELLPPLAEEAGAFLRSLHLYVYALGEANESWGRSTVEAMLSGAVPLVPADPRHHLHRLVPHGVAGYHCRPRGEWGKYARLLQRDAPLREGMARAGRDWAARVLCDPARHRAVWREVLE